MSTETPRKKARWGRRIGILALVAGVVVALGLALLQSGPGKRNVLGIVSSQVHGLTGYTLRTTNPSGIWPFQIGLESLSLSDAEGTFLEISGVDIRLSGAALLRGSVHVARLHLDWVSLSRLPESEDVSPDTDSPVSPPHFEEWPTLPAWIAAPDINIKTLHLGEAVVADFPPVSVQGALVPQNTPAATLHVAGLQENSLDLKLDLELEAQRLALTATFKDRVFLAAMVEEAAELDGTLGLEGPPEALQFSTQIAVNQDALLALDGRLQLAEIFVAAIEGNVQLDAPILAKYVPDGYRETLSFSLPEFSWDETSFRVPGSTITLGGATPLAQVNLSLITPLDGATVEIDLQAFAPDLNRFYPNLAPEPLPLSLALRVEGPLDALQTTVQATVQDDEAATGDFLLALGDTQSINGQFRILPLRDLLGDAASDLFREGMTLGVDGHRDPVTGFTLNRLSIDADENTLSANGVISADFQTVQLEASIVAPRLDVFAPLSPVDLAGSLDAQIQLSANEGDSQIDVTLDGAQLVISEYRIEKGVFRLEATGGALPDEVLNGFSATLDGTLDAVSGPAYTAAQLRLSGVAQPQEQGDIVLRDLIIDDGNVKISGEGRLAPDLESIDLNILLAAEDLSPYIPSEDLSFLASLQGEARVLRTGSDAPIGFRAGLQLASLRNASAEIQSLIGQETQLVIEGNYTDILLEIEEFNVTGPSVDLSGKASVRLEDLFVDGEMTTTLAELERFSSLADTPLGGSLEARFQTSGFLETGLEVNGSLKGEGLRIDTIQADQFDGIVKMTGIPENPAGDLELSLRYEGETLRGSASFAKDGNTLDISGFRVALTDNTVSGNIRLLLETGSVNGNLDIQAPSLEAFAPIIGQPVAGNLAGTLAFERNVQQLSLAGQLQASDIVYAPAELRIASLHLDTDLRGTFPNLEGALSLSLENAVSGETVLDKVALEFSGADDGAIVFTANVAGNYGLDYPIALQSAGRVSADGSNAQIEVMQGQLSVVPIELRSPIQYFQTEDGREISSFTVRIGEAELRARGALQGTELDAEIRWTNLAFAPFAQLGAPPLSGESNGHITLSGVMDAPILRAEIEILDFHPGEIDPEIEQANVDIQLNASLGNGQASLNLAANIEEALTASARLETPLIFSLSPWDLSFPEGGALDGRIEAQGQMDALGQALGLADHLLEGQLDARYTITGTPEAPFLSGAAVWENGRYENTQTSTIYENIQAELSAEGRHISLARFEGRDPTGGTIRAEGKIDLDPEELFPFHFEATARRTRLVHRDDLSAFADGVLTISGNTERIQIDGDLTAGPATIVVPERLPASELRVVEFTEINREAAGLDPLEEKEKEPSAIMPAIHFNIKVNLPNQVYVRAPALDSEWQGNLEILGTAADPRVGGILRVLRGHVDFLGRRFDLRTSSISFDRTIEPAPYLDILAATQTREVTARVRARGEFDNLQITMESEPALPQDEVLSQVLFNRRLSEVSPLQAIQLAQAANALRGGNSGSRLLGGGSTLPGIDRLDFRQGSTPGETAIGVGKNLGDNIYVEVQQSVGVESSKVLVQVEVSPRFHVEAEAGASATSGVGVFYKKDY